MASRSRFHGRVEGQRDCARPGCPESGEFRAPAGRGANFDGPGDWQWLCLDHVREFNTGYNYFSGMSTEEIEAAQTPYGGWERETRAFSQAGLPAPRWADFTDPLDAIGARFRRAPQDEQRKDGRGFPYYWIGFQRSRMDPEAGTDLFAIRNNEISVTPLSLDYTHDASLARLSEAFR